MESQDDRLRRLLAQWRAPEPAGDFAANVQRRIRQLEPSRQPSFVDWLLNWLPRPALALAVAIIAGMTIGIGSGWVSVPPVQEARQNSTGPLAPGTLAGSYVPLTQR